MIALSLDGFNEEEKMDSYDESNIASSRCPACGNNIMIPEPEKKEKMTCPYCGCIIRGKVLGENLEDNDSEDEKEKDDDEM